MPPTPTAPIIAPLAATPEIRAALAGLLIETVAQGGSVGFLHPLPLALAQSFWEASLQAAASGARIVLGAWIAGELAGTVTLLLDMPPNQPHRAEIAKMMTSPAQRGQGIASALLREAERLARQHRRTLLVLDTAASQGAAPFYEKHGFERCGEIPDYALKPHGGLTATILYFKRLPP